MAPSSARLVMEGTESTWAGKLFELKLISQAMQLEPVDQAIGEVEEGEAK